MKLQTLRFFRSKLEQYKGFLKIMLLVRNRGILLKLKTYLSQENNQANDQLHKGKIMR